MKKYYTDLVDRAVRTAAQSAILAVGSESLSANALTFDYKVMAGFAAGGAVLSVLTTLAQRGIFGKTEAN